MKVKKILLTLALSTTLFVGCARPLVKTPQVTKPAPITSPQTITPPATTPSVTTPNVVTTAVPKLTINSPNGTIEHGTFKGDLYVYGNNLQLKDTTIEGNVYFTTNEAKSTFKMDSKSKVTGKQELATTPNVVNTTSTVSTTADFEKAISRKGTQIIAIKKNLTFNKELIVDGEFNNEKALMERKIYLYSQGKDNNITTRFTLTVPKLTIKSTQTIIEHGTFIGDLYVTSNNFRLIDTTIKGNVYFTTDEAKSTFIMDSKSKVTGKQELKK
ncbi:hypothetical protein G9F71_018000 [Clostridium sp. FP2]|uniref:hypothetical protein n=1 Tax=Clostridium TaxID=1485 RepID=UPI0013E91054|nr:MULTISPECIES: hypothetical protein [Clostridium]MBW9155116.1 hypothetical protein [Clostridium tagluense]MBZ9624744.1 hypothetical protein [Clostridium sp. FP2]WLC64555.1 hypothetical protein KTC93_17060 [Clostridium tagluense]